MKYKMDHIYGEVAGATVDLTPINNKIAALEAKDTQLTTNINTVDTKVTNLSNIAVKNNIQNQVLPQQKINQAPTDPQHIVRNDDIKWERIINQTGTLAANTKHSWTVNLSNNSIYEYTGVVVVTGYDGCFGGIMSINLYNYYNNCQVFSFAAAENNTNETLRVKIWTNGGKVHLVCSQQISGFRLMVRKNKGF